MTARGIRNKNPGNIRHDTDGYCDWQHVECNDATREDKSFCTFDSMVYGIRALIKTLITYTTKRGCKSVYDIIHRWAPTNENNTQAYINSVCKRVGVEPREELDFKADPTLYLDIAKAIAFHENGNDAELITEEQWNQGYELALNR